MTGFRLFDVVFALAAPQLDFESALRSIFSLCPQTEAAADILIGSRFVSGEGVSDVLPAWLLDWLRGLDRAPGRVSMRHGPGGEAASATFVDGMASVAWTSPDFTRIDIAVWKPDPGPDESDTSGGGEPRAQAGFATSSIHSVLPPVLREILLKRGRMLVHSAVLQCPCGTGLLLSASGGGGKTTTALSVLRAGGRLLGDDMNVLDIADDSVSACGFPELLNITEHTTGFFPELGEASDLAPEGSGSHKKAVSPVDVYGESSVVESCGVGVIYFVKVCDEGPAVAPLRGADAFGRLMHAQTFANGQVPDDFAFERLSAILDRTEVYELRSGPDPCRLGEWLIENCGVHAKRSGTDAGR